MKVLCDACGRLLDLSIFRVEGRSLAITCAGCGVEHVAGDAVRPPMPSAPPLVPTERVGIPSTSPFASNVVALRDIAGEAASRAAKSIRERPFDAPPGRCPKCIGARVASDESCRQCGLVFSQLDEAALAPSDWLRDEWLALLTRWSDALGHDALISQGMVRGELPGIGRLYRIRLVDMPEDPLARRGRDEVLRHANINVPTASDSGVSVEQRQRENLKRWVTIFGVCIFAVIIFLVMRGLLGGS